MNSKNKYDIGIYTFWNVPNYGTFAQAYALQKAIQSIYPERDVKQIAYLDTKHFDFYYSRKPVCKPWKRRFLKELIVRNSFSITKKREMFLKSYKTINHTISLSSDELSKAEFETVIIGSDIVWDYSFKCFNNDEFLFGNGFNSRNILSYAASFGTISLQATHPNYVISGIKTMKMISVRDEKSQEIIQSITGVKPTIVLDPTWLWNFNDDDNIVASHYKNYMIIYGQDFTEDFVKQIIIYARRRGLLLVCLDCNNDDYDWCDVVLKQHDLSPFEWLGLFRDAKTVATTTFHGLTFSLIFNKQFAFCKTDFILAKAGSFLKDLDLYQKFTDPSVSVEKMIEEDWDYTKINLIIDEKRNNSMDFIISAIEQRGDINGRK